MRILLTLSILVIFFSTASAQVPTISGQIISDEDDLGLPGVSVVVKGTAKTTLLGTVTHINGDFTLSIVRAGGYCAQFKPVCIS